MADDGARDLFAVFISNDNKQVSFLSLSLSSSTDLNILVAVSRSSLALNIVVVHQTG